MGEQPDLDRELGIGGMPVCTNCSVNITSDRPLVTTYFDPTIPPATAPGGLVPGLGGGAPALAGIIPPVSGLVPAVAGDVPAIAGSGAALASLTTYDVVSSYTANITVTKTNFSSISAVCSVLSQFSAISCNETSFTISNNDITASGTLQVNLSGHNGVNLKANVNSNGLSMERLVLKQVSNTSNDQSTTDGIFYFKEYNNELYFTAANQVGGYKIYKTDGTTISQFSNIRNDQAAADSATGFEVLGNELYFKASNQNGFTKLFKTDGSTITQVSNTTNDQGVSDNVLEVIEYNGDIYFTANNRNGAFQKIFKYDGTTVTQFSNIRNNQNFSGHVKDLTVVNNELYFYNWKAGGTNNSGVPKLYKTDGTTITQVSNTTNNQSFSDSPSYLYAFNNELYFSSTSPSPNYRMKLFKTDGSTITQVSNTTNNQTVADTPQPIFEFNNELYFRSLNQSAAYKIYKTDGSTITQFSNLSGDQAVSDTITETLIFNNELYFIGNNQNGFTKIFKTDGSTITQLSNTANDQSTHDLVGFGVSDKQLVVYNDSIYFIAINPAGLYKLHRIKNNEIHQVSDLRPGEHDFRTWGAYYCDSLIVFDNKLYVSMVTPTAVGSLNFCQSPAKLFTLCDPAMGCLP